MRHVAAYDRYIGAGINWIALIHQPFHDRFGVVGLEQRPVITPDNPLHQHLQFALQPNGDPGFGYQATGFIIHIGTAAGCKYLRTIAKQPGNDTPFTIAKIGFSVISEDFRNCLAGGTLDFCISVHELQTEAGCDPATNSSLARTHQADQDNAP